MKLTNKYISCLATGVMIAGALASCSEEKLDDQSIFDTTDVTLDPNSYTYKFDRWIQKEYTEPYNLTFIYKMEDLATDMDYNLVPAEYNKAQELAVLTKYLWFDVYTDLVGIDFLKQYGPKILHLIGSTAINPANGTEILGLAEGGLKVSLFRVNQFDPNDFEQLNEKYFKTMHHEFAHILHQTKTYPKEFDLITADRYEPMGWQDRSGAVVASYGCTSAYASGQAREDFAETIANYITRTDEQWDLTLWLANRGWQVAQLDNGVELACTKYYYANATDRANDMKTLTGCFVEADGIYTVTDICVKVDASGSASDDSGNYGVSGGNMAFKTVPDIEAYFAQLAQQYDLYDVVDTDNVDGKAVILQKTSIARNWLESAWNLDLDKLRDEVQFRQRNFDLDALLSEIENVQ